MRRFLLPLALLVASGLSSAQNVGSQLPSVELEDFSKTKATSFDDFLGRAVLLEFFAHW